MAGGDESRELLTGMPSNSREEWSRETLEKMMTGSLKRIEYWDPNPDPDQGPDSGNLQNQRPAKRARVCEPDVDLAPEAETEETSETPETEDWDEGGEVGINREEAAVETPGLEPMDLSTVQPNPDHTINLQVCNTVTMDKE